MVLQRDKPIQIWGWASVGEAITVHFHNKKYSTRTGADKKWKLLMSPFPAGGPYSMRISGSSIIEIKNILLGDVWLCSGQSNMEFTLAATKGIYKEEIAGSATKFIRQFAIRKDWSFMPGDDIESWGWKEADSTNINSFTAAGFFMAKELYQTYKVPIGLINATWGGSPLEAWTSIEGLKRFPAYVHQVNYYKDPLNLQETIDKDKVQTDLWFHILEQQEGQLKALHKDWQSAGYDDKDWKEANLPGPWETQDLKELDGMVWIRKEVVVPEQYAGKEAKLFLGHIEEQDSTWWNEEFIGTAPTQYHLRKYNVRSGLLKAGKNLIAIKVIDTEGKGGLRKENEYYLLVGNDTLSLGGKYKYKVAAIAPIPLSQKNLTTFYRKPSVLYNAMIAPFSSYRLKGIAWYQGENNLGRDSIYRLLFTDMIRDWRSKFDDPRLPFVFVQLPNFKDPDTVPAESVWARLREAQATALKLPYTAMAVTYDIGEADDIHPLNKKDVGFRLAQAVKKIAYGSPVVYAGPYYRSMSVEGNKIVLSFSNAGNGLAVKNGKFLRHFAIAGEDKKFFWANAEIKGDKVVVWSKDVPKPIAVRYAWADNPEGANLINKEGFLAAPFRSGF